MARLRNITTGVVVDVGDDLAGNLSRWEWEPADKPAPATAVDKPAEKKPAAKAPPKPTKK